MKPLVFPVPSLFMLVFGRENSLCDEMGTVCDVIMEPAN